jgi:hypothetical protein
MATGICTFKGNTFPHALPRQPHKYFGNMEHCPTEAEDEVADEAGSPREDQSAGERVRPAF